MNCPVCKTVNLMMSERQGVEIDYCPQCRGVWLDRGELDKLIDKAAAAAEPAATQRPASYPQLQPGYGSRDAHDSGYYKKKRKGLLSDIFDF